MRIHHLHFPRLFSLNYFLQTRHLSVETLAQTSQPAARHGWQNYLTGLYIYPDTHSSQTVALFATHLLHSGALQGSTHVFPTFV